MAGIRHRIRGHWLKKSEMRLQYKNIISAVLRTMPQGTYGIGLEFEMSDGLPVVCGIKPGGGCSAHDIKEGDVLVRVNKTCISARMVRSAQTHPAAGSSNRNQVYTETFSGV